MDTDNNASTEAGEAMPVDEERQELGKQVIAAAERSDHLGFAAAAQRYGSLEEAQALVRSRGIVRSIDRMAGASLPVLELQDAPEDRSSVETRDDEDTPTMFGHFSVFDEWTEIDSWFEGRFMERVARGAFKKTFRENRSGIRALFQHGYDPSIGDKPLGPIDDLREDDVGGYYEVPLLDAAYVRQDVLPGLREGLYGASFKFRTMREEFAEDVEASAHNPSALPERTLKELRVYEFGPVTFPAYEGATAGVRSLSTPLLRTSKTTAPSTTDADLQVTSEPERREIRAPRFNNREEWLLWISQT